MCPHALPPAPRAYTDVCASFSRAFISHRASLHARLPNAPMRIKNTRSKPDLLLTRFKPIGPIFQRPTRFNHAGQPGQWIHSSQTGSSGFHAGLVQKPASFPTRSKLGLQPSFRAQPDPNFIQPKIVQAGRQPRSNQVTQVWPILTPAHHCHPELEG